MAEINKRIAFLDGLRGVAILLVVLHHAYAKWPQFVLYGDQYALFPIFKYGWLGVDIFFMISGFVILMTLEKTANFFDFLFRRWLRLFPAMLIISGLVFVTAGAFFPERVAGIPQWRDLIPGLTFVEEEIWQKVFNSPQGMLEGAFWSLFVEVKFYVIFGMMFFILGANKAIVGLLGLFLLYILKVPFMWELSADCMGWFAAGALFYQYFKFSDKKWLLMGFLTALVSAYFVREAIDAKLAAVFIAGLFTGVIMNERLQASISSRFLVFVGFVSYPLYLVHENMMVALIVKFGKWMPWMPGFLLPIIPIAFVVGISYLVASYAEPWLRDLIRASLDAKSRKLQGS